MYYLNSKNLRIVVRSAVSSPALERDRELQSGRRHRPLSGFRFRQYNPRHHQMIRSYRFLLSKQKKLYIFMANGKITTPVTRYFEIYVLKCMESNNLDQLGETRRRREQSHTARRIIFSHKSNRVVNLAVLFIMDLNRQ